MSMYAPQDETFTVVSLAVPNLSFFINFSLPYASPKDIINFSGRLMEDGTPVSGEQVRIVDVDYGGFIRASGWSDAGGFYSIDYTIPFTIDASGIAGTSVRFQAKSQTSGGSVTSGIQGISVLYRTDIVAPQYSPFPITSGQPFIIFSQIMVEISDGNWTQFRPPTAIFGIIHAVIDSNIILADTTINTDGTLTFYFLQGGVTPITLPVGSFSLRIWFDGY